MSLNGHGQIPLKVPKVEFNFDVSVDGIQMLTDTSKSNSTLGTQLQAIACKDSFSTSTLGF